MTVIIGASTCAVGGAFQVSSFYLWSDIYVCLFRICLLKSLSYIFYYNIICVFALIVGCYFLDESLMESDAGMNVFICFCFFECKYILVLNNFVWVLSESYYKLAHST